MSTETHYDVLGVEQTASEKEIKKAFHQKSLKHHPDRNLENKEEATMIYQKITLAYETLSDAQKRAEYDHELKYGPSRPGMPPDMNDIFASMFGGHMGGMPMGGIHMGGMPGFMGGFGGFPGFMFSEGEGVHVFQMGPNGFQQINRNQPIMKHIEISLETAFNGGSYTFDLERNIIDNGNRVTEIESITIDIPKGIADDDVLVMRGKGHRLSQNMPPGEVKIVFTVTNTTDFIRVGNDLIYHKKITLFEALCGFSMEIKHINGKILSINNHGATSTVIKPGYKRTIHGMGMTKGDQTGNLIIEFDIEFPEKITEQQAECLKQAFA